MKIPQSLDSFTYELCLRVCPTLGYTPSWKKTWEHAEGYLALSVPNHPHAMRKGHVYLHRVVAECLVGRILGRDEIAHHVNGNRGDNRSVNISVVSRKEHGVIHAPEENKEELVCDFCGKSFYRDSRDIKSRKKNGFKHSFCSRSCMGKLAVRSMVGFGLPPLPIEEKRARKAARMREYRRRVRERKLDKGTGVG